MDDAALLGALPIAAAVLTHNNDGAIRLQAHNERFRETVAQSTCSALEWDDAECLKAGPIAELLTKFFAGTDPLGELDFRDGEGFAARYFRIKLAPLPNAKGAPRRCLLSVVDRSVEVQAERTLRAEMLRDSLTGFLTRSA